MNSQCSADPPFDALQNWKHILCDDLPSLEMSAPINKHTSSNQLDYFDNCLSVFADSRGPCSRRSCRADSLCVESGDMAFCECEPSECGLHLNPVCGSDGATYKNHCLLRKAACIKEESIAVLDQGPCSKSLEPLFFTYPKKHPFDNSSMLIVFLGSKILRRL